MPKPRITRQGRFDPRHQKYYDWCNAIRILAKQQEKEGWYINWETVTITFFVEMPKSWSQKKKNKMNMTPHRQKPDLDNFTKSVQDALLKEDSHVWHYFNLKKMWAEKGEISIGTIDV